MNAAQQYCKVVHDLSFDNEDTAHSWIAGNTYETDFARWCLESPAINRQGQNDE